MRIFIVDTIHWIAMRSTGAKTDGDNLTVLSVVLWIMG